VTGLKKLKKVSRTKRSKKIQDHERSLQPEFPVWPSDQHKVVTR
jgi:hypothetical protein